MKKIYILTAVFALLTLSLNAQTTYEKVMSTDDLTDGAEYLIVCENQGVIFDGSLTDLNSTNYYSVTPNNGVITYSADLDNRDFTITASGSYYDIKSASGYYIGITSSSNAISYRTTPYDDKNTITISNGVASISVKLNNATRPLKCNSDNKNFRYYKSNSSNVEDIQLYKKVGGSTPTAELTAPTNGSTVNVGTNTGSGVSKEITVSGSNLTADLTVSVSGTGFSVSPTAISAANANAGTNVTVTYNGTVENATGTLTISSSEVSTTVNLTATYNSGTTPTPDYGTLALFDTTNYVAEVLPVYGYNHDCTQHNQMIYPASLLTDMQGTTIKSMTFYPGTYSSGWSTYSGINFRNGTVTFKLMEVNGSTGFDSSNPAFITGTMSPVATITMPSTANTSATEWLIEFDNDYEYNGGDLVIDVTTTTGNYGSTYFEVGTTASLNVAYPGYYNYTGSYNGSSAVDFVPRVTFTYESSMPKTDAPTITVGDPTATDVTVTATATDPTASVTLTIGDRTETGTGSVSITIDRGTADQNLTATATAQEDGKRVSDPATAAVFVPALPKTEMPTISVVTNADGSKTISATGNGTVHLYIDGNEVENPYTIMPSADGDVTVTVTATAQEEGKLVSDPAEQIVTVAEAGRSPMPIITFTDNGDGSYTITATGTGEVSLYINDAEHGGTSGNPIVTGQGSVSITVEQHSQTMTIPIQATNQEGDLLVSHTAEGTYTIPALTIDNSFETLDPQPANASTPINMSKLMFVDRFSVEIPNENNHPHLYDNYLQETQVRQRTSNSVNVPVKHTGSDGLGFYTLGQLDGDTDAKLMMDVRNAAMDLPLESDPGIYFYTAQRGTKAYPDQADRKYLGVLQRTSDGNYQETLNPSYDYEEIYPGGEHHIHYDTDTIQGEWNEYLTYVPVVWTMGFDRVLYESDHIHNSYGAPKWKTGVADVELKTQGDDKPIAQRQTNKNNSVNWGSGAEAASLYMLDNIVATAKMPTVNTMPYEPYMFRIFVESKNGLLRNYTVVPAGDGTYDGEHLEGVTTSDADAKGPRCVWSGYVNDPLNGQKGVEITEGTGDGNSKTYTFKKVKVDRTAGYDDEHNPLGEWDKDGMNAVFGALDVLTNGETIAPDDLQIFVRFYYVVEGAADGHTPWEAIRGAKGEGDAPAGYGSESNPGSPGPATAVSEIRYHGEVVSTTYYNIQGMESDKPFDGVNIVVTRFSDGTTSVSKVVR